VGASEGGVASLAAMELQRFPRTLRTFAAALYRYQTAAFEEQILRRIVTTIYWVHRLHEIRAHLVRVSHSNQGTRTGLSWTFQSRVIAAERIGLLFTAAIRGSQCREILAPSRGGAEKRKKAI